MPSPKYLENQLARRWQQRFTTAEPVEAKDSIDPTTREQGLEKVRARLAAAYSELGDALLEVGDLERAEMNYRSAAQLSALDDSLLLKLGMLHVTDERWDRALLRFEAAIGVDGGSAAAWCGVARAHREQGHWHEAIESSVQGLARHLANGPLLAELAHSLRDCGDLDAAVNLYHEALAVRPEQSDAVVGEALVLELWGELQRASELLAPYWESDEDPVATITLARVKGKLGSGIESIALLEQLQRDVRLGRRERRLFHFTLAGLLEHAKSTMTRFGTSS